MTLLNSMKKGALFAMLLSSGMIMNDAQALTVYTAGPGSLAKKPRGGL
ncbi:ABC transporter substrate-binding protein [Erwinia rhapontici]